MEQRRKYMNARTKLNYAYIEGSLLIAALLGLVLQSWPIFFAALVALLIGNVVNGGIRPSRRHG
jgi:hypothetical protein